MTFMPSNLEKTHSTFVERISLGDVKSSQLIGLVREIIRGSDILTSRYTIVEVVKILECNCQNNLSVEENINALLAGLSILEKYGKNLLRPDRPHQWRIVRLSNPIFHARVDNLKGTRGILMQMGYSYSVPDGLSYPSNIALPDLGKVALVTSDIVLLKYELLLLQKGQHPNPQSIVIYTNNVQHQSAPQLHSVLSKPSTSKSPSEQSYSPKMKINSIPNISASATNNSSNLPMDQICDVCGQKRSEYFCQFCNMKQCKDCDNIWHQNQLRLTHKRNAISHAAQNVDTHSSRNSQPQSFRVPETHLVQNNRIEGRAELNVSDKNQLNDHVFRILEMEDSQQKQERVKSLLESIDKQIIKYTNASENLSQSSTNASKHLIEKASVLWDQKEGIVSMFQSVLNLNFQDTTEATSIDISTRVESWPNSYNDSGNDRVDSRPPVRFLHQEEQAMGEPPMGDLPAGNLPLGEVPAGPISIGEPLFSENKKANIVGNSEGCQENFEMQQDSFMNEIRGPPQMHTPQSSYQSSFNDHAISLFSSNSQSFKPEEPLFSMNDSFPDTIPSFNVDLFTDMSLEEMQKKTQQENMRMKCVEMIGFLKDAELHGYTAEHVEIAVNYSKRLKSVSPLQWLKVHWEKHVQNLNAECMFATYEEASEMFLKSGGDTNQALDLLMNIKAQKISEVGLSQYFSDEEILESLCKESGDISKARKSLENLLLGEMRKRVGSKIYETESHFDIFNKIEDRKHRNNALIAYCDIRDDNVSEILFKIFDETKNEGTVFHECDLEDIVEACKAFPENFEGAVKYLRTECNICYESFPQSKVECLTACGEKSCRYCRKCLATYLRFKVNEGNIRDMVCPVCSLPDIDEDEEVADTYFSKLDMVIKMYLEPEVHELFQRKLRDSTLMKMPNFRWCFHCTNGFEYNEGNLKMVCSMCHKATCFSCKKGWEPQHDGISCEQFREWKESNDPNFQVIGLAAHLKENGIDCPKCKFKYALTKGGCIHFKCLKCSFHFCSGCQRPFKSGNVCSVSTKCSNLGLHAHHPRDCLFFLRDFETDILKEILTNGNVPFNVESTTGHDVCQVPEQKDTADGGYEDTVCGSDVSCADLCSVHFREYLVSLINRHRLDPASVYTINELKTCLNRSEVDFPEQDVNQNEQDYRFFLLGLVKKLPLIEGNEE